MLNRMLNWMLHSMNMHNWCCCSILLLMLRRLSPSPSPSLYPSGQLSSQHLILLVEAHALIELEAPGILQLAEVVGPRQALLLHLGDLVLEQAHVVLVPLADTALRLAVVGPLAGQLGLAEVADGAFACAASWVRWCVSYIWR